MTTNALKKRTACAPSLAATQQRDHERLVVELVDRIELLVKEKEELQNQVRDMQCRLRRDTAKF